MNVCVVTGKESLRVDCVLGEGAFATVYQATNPVTLEKTVLKVRLRMKSAASLSRVLLSSFFFNVVVKQILLNHLRNEPCSQRHLDMTAGFTCVLAAGSEAGQSLGVLHQHPARRSAEARRPSPLQQYALSSPLP